MILSYPWQRDGQGPGKAQLGRVSEVQALLLHPKEVFWGPWGLRDLWGSEPINSGVWAGQVLFFSGVPALQDDHESRCWLGDGVPPQGALGNLLCVSLGESTSPQSALHLQPQACRSIPFSCSRPDASWPPWPFSCASSLWFSWSLSAACLVALWPSCFLTCFLFPRDFENCIHSFVEEGEGKVIPC